MVVTHGVLWGWVGVIFLAVSGAVKFSVTPSSLGIDNYCLRVGYPKQQDYFWYAAVLLAPWVGTAVNLWLRRVLARRGWRGWASGWPSVAGVSCLGCALVFSFSAYYATAVGTVLLAMAGLALPWLDREWYRERMACGAPEEPAPPTTPRLLFWILGSAAVAVLAVADPCIGYRILDPMHEGHHLAYVQSYLAGDLPGIDVYSAYAPLFTYSVIWWMKAFDLTVVGERWYFMLVQIGGTAAHLALLWWICRTWRGRLIGGLLMLVLSTSLGILYGWANALRTAIPLAALIVAWRGVDAGRVGTVAVSGCLIGIAWLYSQEYASAAVLAVVGMGAAVALRGRSTAVARNLVLWGGCGLGTVVLLLFIMFGWRLGEAVSHMATGGASHFFGQGAVPFPQVLRLEGLGSSGYWGGLGYLLELWSPALLGGAVGAWLLACGRGVAQGRGPLVIALLVFMIVIQPPALVRPITHLASSAPGFVALAALVLDVLVIRGGWFRRAAVAGGVLLVVYGAARQYSNLRVNVEGKFLCAKEVRARPARLVERLGKTSLTEDEERRLAGFVGKIRDLCPSGERVYQTTFLGGALCFLADRAAMPPYPSGFVVVTAAQRARSLEALERSRPPVALIAKEGLDGSLFEVARAEEWSYVSRNYVLRDRYSDVMLFVRMVPGLDN